MSPTTPTEGATTCVPFAKVEANGMPARRVTQPAGPQPQDTGDSRDRQCQWQREVSIQRLQDGSGETVLLSNKSTLSTLNTYTHAESPEWGRGDSQMMSHPGSSMACLGRVQD